MATLDHDLQKLLNYVGDLGKIIVVSSFEWLPKVQKIAQSGHTAWDHAMRSKYLRQFGPIERRAEVQHISPSIWNIQSPLFFTNYLRFVS